MIRLFGLVITTSRRYDREQVKAWDLGRACGRLGIMVEQGLLSEADLAAIERAAERER